MQSLAFGLTAARIRNLQEELKHCNESLNDLEKKIKEINDRKMHLKKQLEKTKLQTADIKRLLL
jgi:predicted  nucleic acid-binding Zn-ribbon protein